MRLGTDRHALLDLEVEQDLIGVKITTEIPEGRPVHAAAGWIAPFAFQNQLSVARADVQFIVVGIEQFDSVLRALRKRNAMPHLFMRTIGAGLTLSGPSGNLELGPARRKPRIVHAVFDLSHDNSQQHVTRTRTSADRNGSRRISGASGNQPN